MSECLLGWPEGPDIRSRQGEIYSVGIFHDLAHDSRVPQNKQAQQHIALADLHWLARPLLATLEQRPIARHARSMPITCVRTSKYAVNARASLLSLTDKERQLLFYCL